MRVITLCFRDMLERKMPKNSRFCWSQHKRQPNECYQHKWWCFMSRDNLNLFYFSWIYIFDIKLEVPEKVHYGCQLMAANLEKYNYLNARTGTIITCLEAKLNLISSLVWIPTTLTEKFLNADLAWHDSKEQ